MNILSDKKILFVILLCGLLVRFSLIFFINNPRLFNDADSVEYLAIAENMRLGHGFSWDGSEPYRPNSFRTPIYPGFLFLSRILSGSYESALVIQSILVVLSAYFLFLIGKEYFSRKIALWSTAIFLFVPFSLNVSVKFLTQSLFSFLLILSVWGWLKFLKTGRSRYFILVSFILPALALTRPIAQYIILVFVLSLFYSAYTRQINLNLWGFLKKALMMTSIFILVLLPWLMRNYKTLGYFKLSSITPYQLYFYEVPDAYALAKGISYHEASLVLRGEIDDYSKISDFGDYMEFSSQNFLTDRNYYYMSQFPGYFAVSKAKNMIKFFLRDGIRYWYNDFNRSARSEINVKNLLIFKEKNLFPYLVALERIFLGILFLGMLISAFFVFKESASFKPVLLFLFFLLFYFSFLTGIMASAGFRFPVEPFFLLVGLNGIKRYAKR